MLSSMVHALVLSCITVTYPFISLFCRHSAAPLVLLLVACAPRLYYDFVLILMSIVQEELYAAVQYFLRAPEEGARGG